MKISKKSALFLDRDGVVNVRTPGDYVKRVAEFQFENGALEAIAVLSRFFSKIFVVTNQAGIGKGLMTEAQLLEVHDFMLKKIMAAGGRIERVYFCPHRSDAGCICRKPAPGMAFQAKKDFPEIDFKKSWMAGDSASDMLFAKNLGMKSILILGKTEETEALAAMDLDGRFESLLGFANFVMQEDFSQARQ